MVASSLLAVSKGEPRPNSLVGRHVASRKHRQPVAFASLGKFRIRYQGFKIQTAKFEVCAQARCRIQREGCGFLWSFVELHLNTNHPRSNPPKTPQLIQLPSSFISSTSGFFSTTPAICITSFMALVCSFSSSLVKVLNTCPRSSYSWPLIVMASTVSSSYGDRPYA